VCERCGAPICWPMKLVVFGLSVSSSWGNGHATLWRGLIAALARQGHEVVFFERDVPYYASHRDLSELPGARLVLYPDWGDALGAARRELDGCDVGIVTSYCPDGAAASALVLDAPLPLRVFYDLDTPITLGRLARGERVDYLPDEGLGDFDLVLSYTGGRALDELADQLGARRVAPLYGSVDPAVHDGGSIEARFAADLSYLGTYAEDRQAGVDALLIEAARRRPRLGFVVGGAMYPAAVKWPDNVRLVEHVPPSVHPAFYGSSRLTLSVTRAPMAALGFCPSGRLFEAAACGVPVVSDWWEGLDAFFTPGEEILIARSTDDVLAALDRAPEELLRIGRAARERALEEHTAERRAGELVAILEGGIEHVGHHSGSRRRQPHPAAGVLQGAPADR
jgi:spore maturation protein CgeB